MDIMSILSYATEIPFKKKMFLPHLEVVSSYFCDSWGMFSTCTPEILSYFFWAIFTYKLFFFTPGIPPQTRSSTLLYSTVYSIQCISSMPYTIWSLASFKCYFLCFASRSLFRLLWFAHQTLPGHLLGTLSLLSDPPSPLHTSRFYLVFKAQTNATSPRKPLCFLDPWSPRCFFLSH